jgi:glycerol-3-phosphate acyltransferase PlsX
MIRIAVDAMGGDRAPQAIVSGAIEAARKAKDRYEVVLVGNEDEIQAEIRKHHFMKDIRLSVVHATQKVEMDEAPAQAMKRKPDSSIAVAMKLHKDGKVDGVVSAGNTGAVLAAGLFLLRPIEGVMRPSVGAFIPRGRGNGLTFLIDGGANVDCKPAHLMQFGAMGSILMTHLFGIERPKVGLLNVGEEPTKGNETVLEAFGLLEKSALNFIGNVEGRDIMRDKADVVVCDGFTGNVLVKFAGSLSKVLSSTLKRKIRGNIAGNIGHFLMQHKFTKFIKVFDYQEYGGAPLLGVKGTVIISHGSSSSYAISNAIDVAFKLIQKEIPRRIEILIHQMKGPHGQH